MSTVFSRNTDTADFSFVISKYQVLDTTRLGSIPYSNKIRIYAAKYGSKAALHKIMADVDQYAAQINKNSYEDNLRLYKLVSYYVYQSGTIDMKTHYFRNKLNKAPKTLKELLLLNDRLPASRRWKLLSPSGSLYHMQGRDGIFNLKFVSGDGFCEAVYNKSGALLTERNDPVNMGTFNYAAGIPRADAHEKYDVSPYLKWGNSPNSPQKGNAAIQKGISEAADLYNKHASSVEQYRSRVMTPIFKKT